MMERRTSVDAILFYTYLGFTWLAILVYLFAAFYGFRYLTGLGKSTEISSKSLGLVLAGGLLMLIATGVNVAFNVVRSGNWWDAILIVNAADLLINAAFLHTLYWRWNLKWPAWLTIVTILVDANLRFIILFFF
jgi:hypothetical protein